MTLKQYEAVIQTLEQLGGIATLGQLNQEVFKIANCNWNTKTPFASIRRIVQTRPKEIYKVRPGLYALVSHKGVIEGRGIFEQTKHNEEAKEVNEFNHYYYQGILLMVGEIKKLETYVPAQDKNRKFIDNRTLAEMSTLQSIPNYSYNNIVSRSATVDVIWFNERKMPHTFFEVEHSTDIQNSLVKFNDLRDFHSRMVIVADLKRKKEYESKIRYSSFDELIREKRVSFLSYDELNKQYERLVEQQAFEFIL